MAENSKSEDLQSNILIQLCGKLLHYIQKWIYIEKLKVEFKTGRQQSQGSRPL